MRFLSCALLRNSVYIYRLALMAPTTNPFSERQNREEFDFRRGTGIARFWPLSRSTYYLFIVLQIVGANT